MGAGLSTDPVFSDDGKRFAVLVGNRAEVWDLATRERIAVCKSAGLAYPGGLALNRDASRLALRNESGLIDVIDVASGGRISRIKRGAQCGFNLALSPDGAKVFDASGGPQAGLFVWDADTGGLLHGYTCGFDFMATSLSRTRDGLVAAGFMAKADACERGLRDFLWLWTEPGLEKIELNLCDCTTAISPDGEHIFVAGLHRPLHQQGEAVFRLLDRSGTVRIEKNMRALRTFPVSQPVWHPDGSQLLWRGDCLVDEAWLLDAETLDVARKFHWPSMHAALGQHGWIALAGDKGMVLPQTAVEQAVAEVGQPAAELKKRRSQAYSRAIELRKASPPRVALFLDEERLRIEAEQLVGLFRYLPVEDEVCELESADTVDIGRAIRHALRQFRLGYSESDRYGERGWLQEAWMSDDFAARLRENNLPLDWGVSAQKSAQIRYLGGKGRSTPESEGFSNPQAGAHARYLVVTHHDGLLELWLGTTTAAGTFYENDWPHIPLADTITDSELGEAVLAAFGQCKVEAK